MIELASPLQVLAVATAVGWPFVAGLVVVLWSKTRAGERRRRLEVVDARLEGMFRSIESKPVPERLLLVMEALEEAQAMQRKVASKRPNKAAASVS